MITQQAEAEGYLDPHYHKKIKQIIYKLLTILDAIHAKNIVHRDIKPNNILIRHSSPFDDEVEVLLADFGMAEEVSLDNFTELQ